MDNSGYADLALTIVAQMVKDYHKNLYHIALDDFKTESKKREALRTVIDYERFFKSGRFHLYTKVSGESIIRTIKERVRKEIENGIAYNEKDS